MVWEAREGAVRVRCGGRAANDIADLLPDVAEAAWLRQVHSADVRAARPGPSGEGDALVSDRPDLALVIVTADCVPVLLAAGERSVAAAHAGWRGIVAGVVAATVGRLADHGHGAGEMRAWIGPHIGPCCYEVSDDVADLVVAASAPEVRREGPGPRPLLDLGRAVVAQLERAGVERIERLGPCTRCDPGLWSYRGDGPGAGRNLSAIWRESAETATAVGAAGPGQEPVRA